MPSGKLCAPPLCHSADTTVQQQDLGQGQYAIAGDNSIIIQIQQAAQAQKAGHGGRHMTDAMPPEPVSSAPQVQDLVQIQAANAGDRSVVIQNQNRIQDQRATVDDHGAGGSQADQGQGVNQVQFGDAGGDGAIVIQNQNTIQIQEFGFGSGVQSSTTGHQDQDVFHGIGDSMDFGGGGFDFLPQVQGLNQAQFANPVGDGGSGVAAQSQAADGLEPLISMTSSLG